MAANPRLHHALSRLPMSSWFSCPYLEERPARHQAFFWHDDQGRMDPGLYQNLMDSHFRRSGRMFYRPQCGACTSCIPIRIDTRSFEPSSSQKRVRKRNADVRVRWAPPALDRQRIELYQRYVQHRHGSQSSADDLESFLYDSPTETIEGTYWLGDRLIAAGICDLTTQALSTVYFYFEPEESRRSLGTFSALIEIETALRLDRPYYYLGYWVPGCRKMEYKAALGEHELLIGEEWTAGGSLVQAAKSL